MEIESNGSVLASQPSSPTRISMLMTDPRVGTPFNAAASDAFGSIICLGAPDRDERRRSYVQMAGALAKGAGPRARVSFLSVEKSAQVRIAPDSRQDSVTSFIALPIAISNGASADDAGTAYGPVRYQEHPPAA
jgi:hypothetical protein